MFTFTFSCANKWISCDLRAFVPSFHSVFLIAGRQRRGARGASDKDVTPPLLAKVQGNLEVTCAYIISI